MGARRRSFKIFYSLQALHVREWVQRRMPVKNSLIAIGSGKEILKF